MEGSSAKIFSPTAPTPEQVAAAEQELFELLTASENQPLETMRSAEEVFAEKRKMLEALLNAKV